MKINNKLNIPTSVNKAKKTDVKNEKNEGKYGETKEGKQISNYNANNSSDSYEKKPVNCENSKPCGTGETEKDNKNISIKDILFGNGEKTLIPNGNNAYNKPSITNDETEIPNETSVTQSSTNNSGVSNGTKTITIANLLGKLLDFANKVKTIFGSK